MALIWLLLAPPLRCPVVPWWLESWANYKIRVFVHDKKEVKRWANKEHSLVVLNHSGDLDWMVGWCLIEKLGMLGVSPTRPHIVGHNHTTCRELCAKLTSEGSPNRRSLVQFSCVRLLHVAWCVVSITRALVDTESDAQNVH